MSDIRHLPDLVIRKIAAGEVIERPASALKELLENAIDAEARHIEVILEQAGKRLLQVRDDGCGMSAEDLPLAIAKHATSKLAHDNLDDIRCYGFRGEALASIASVAKVCIRSRQAHDETACELDAIANTIRPTHGDFGTMITVRDLFHATPARLKFLRSDNAEMAAILESLRHMALCAPLVQFRLFEGEKLRLQFAAGHLPGEHPDDPLQAMMPRIAEIFDAEFTEHAYSLDVTRPPYRLHGLISPAAMHRGRADRQFLVVNGRMIRDRGLMGAIRAAYGDLLPKGRYVQFALFLECDPAWLDVNVHPAKTEVRFREPTSLRSLLINALRATLDQRATLTAPTLASGFSPSAIPPRPGVARRQAAAKAQQPNLAADWQPSAYQRIFESEEAQSTDSLTVQPEAYPLGAAKAHVLGNYIVAENSDGLVLIDQHAAHERIVYEKLKADWRDNSHGAIQPLLVPEVLPLQPEDIEKLVEHNGVLEGLGFNFDIFGHDSIVLRSLPALLAESNKAKLLEDILRGIDEGLEVQNLEERIYALLSRVACHGSIRAGRRLKPEEMNILLRQIENTPNAGHCNHGRPTQIFLTRADIEKLFGRS